MIITDFTADKEFANTARKLIERDLYPCLSYLGRFVSINGSSSGSDYLQRNAHIDAVLQSTVGASLTVEEKIVRKRYDAFAIETNSNVGAAGRADGWLYTSTADLLLYAFTIPGGLDCWLMSLPALRELVSARVGTYRATYSASGWGGQGKYTSRCVLVPIIDVPNKRFFELMW